MMRLYGMSDDGELVALAREDRQRPAVIVTRLTVQVDAPDTEAADKVRELLEQAIPSDMPHTVRTRSMKVRL